MSTTPKKKTVKPDMKTKEFLQKVRKHDSLTALAYDLKEPQNIRLKVNMKDVEFNAGTYGNLTIKDCEFEIEGDAYYVKALIESFQKQSIL